MTGPHFTPQEPQLSPKELSQRLDHKIAPKTLANWRSAGRGPRFRRIGNKILYPMSWIEAWEATTEYGSTRDYSGRCAA
jgi:hypothetical protein